MEILNRNIFRNVTEGLDEVCINCKTERAAKDLLNYLAEKNFKWKNDWNLKSLGKTYWNKYEEKTFYRVSFSDRVLTWGLMDRFEETYYEWKPIGNLTKEDLNWDTFKSEKIAVHCKTQQEVAEFLCWINQNKEIEINNLLEACYLGWKDYKERICFEFISHREELGYSSCGFFKSNEFEVIEWSVSKNIFEISGTINTDLSLKDFYEKFIDFIESQNSSFGGNINDVTKEV